MVSFKMCQWRFETTPVSDKHFCGPDSSHDIYISNVVTVELSQYWILGHKFLTCLRVVIDHPPPIDQLELTINSVNQSELTWPRSWR